MTTTTSTSSVDEINQLLSLRRSGHAYDPTREVSKADIMALFEAARWSPSSGNLQPWRYVYAEKSSNPDGYIQLLHLLSENNKEWAHNAPLLVVSAHITTRVNKAGEIIPHTSALHDLGLANMSITVEAMNRGLMTHIIGGFNREAARDFFEHGIQPFVMLAIGYPGDPAHVSEHYRDKDAAPRHRNPIDEFARPI